jgi:hypothetical protein
LNITLNVIPATTTLSVPGAPTLVPVPAGSISGCTAGGNAGQGPPAGAVLGCITRIQAGLVHPSHGTLAASGNTIRFTPAAGYTGPDTFSYEALGVNTDGATALNSGEVTVNVTIPIAAPPATPVPSSAILMLVGLAAFGMWEARRRMQPTVVE